MIRHIVLFTMTEKTRQEGIEEVVKKIRISVENMAREIPGLLRAEFDLNRAENSLHDLVFYSEFDEPRSLDTYQTHPLHEAHKQYSAEYVSNPEVADPF